LGTVRRAAARQVGSGLWYKTAPSALVAYTSISLEAFERP
jgi:hypothetical protein